VGASRGKLRNTPRCVCVRWSTGERQGNRNMTYVSLAIVIYLIHKQNVRPALTVR